MFDNIAGAEFAFGFFCEPLNGAGDIFFLLAQADFDSPAISLSLDLRARGFFFDLGL